MKRCDLLIGLEAEDLDEIAARLAEWLGVSFEERYSDYLGGDYLLARGTEQEVMIMQNLDGDEIAEVEFPHCKSLVRVDGTLVPEVWKSWALEANGVIIRELAY